MKASMQAADTCINSSCHESKHAGRQQIHARTAAAMKASSSSYTVAEIQAVVQNIQAVVQNIQAVVC